METSKYELKRQSFQGQGLITRYERYYFLKAKKLNPLKHPSKQKFDGSSITAIQYLLHSFKRQRSEIHNL